MATLGLEDLLVEPGLDLVLFLDGEFLVVDTRRLPASTSTVTVTITVA